ncbi:Uncharacterized conserved protein YodC, DUF2158 family [Tenacibaculum sp. MAR_2009_124]|uniref:DUF2158 domain-containing protein n=1 Tax=Tenacibaculum sp. MAR_2009_124 TaxID=1250059 RepID=UPI00089BB845|nr:DUF2158 domain-containing protein [Tenacibaculum sp. MAR_2009_124]SEC64664.1 Uncharacterized conserved protein YodC, DUF2158 family [Tenacibaculum sp. MAR_2009_124]
MKNLMLVKNILIAIVFGLILYGITSSFGNIYVEYSKEEIKILKENKNKRLFNIGDIVMLKSGSPNMTIKDTITEIEVDKKLVKFLYKCTWYNENKKWYNDNYAIENFEESELIKVQ